LGIGHRLVDLRQLFVALGHRDSRFGLRL
jgi:hypothetical protein